MLLATWYSSDQEAINVCGKKIVREPKWRAWGTGPTRKRSTCEKDRARTEMERYSLAGQTLTRERVWPARLGEVLVRPGSDQRVKKIVREPKLSRSSPSEIMLERVWTKLARERKRKQRDTASEESKAKEKESDILTWQFAHFLKLFRWPLCYLHRY